MSKMRVSTKNIRRQECANTYKEITELMTLEWKNIFTIVKWLIFAQIGGLLAANSKKQQQQQQL